MTRKNETKEEEEEENRKIKKWSRYPSSKQTILDRWSQYWRNIQCERIRGPCMSMWAKQPSFRQLRAGVFSTDPEHRPEKWNFRNQDQSKIRESETEINRRHRRNIIESKRANMNNNNRENQPIDRYATYGIAHSWLLVSIDQNLKHEFIASNRHGADENEFKLLIVLLTVWWPDIDDLPLNI